MRSQVMQAFGMRLARDVDIITSEAVREKLEPRMERDGIGNHNNVRDTALGCMPLLLVSVPHEQAH